MTNEIFQGIRIDELLSTDAGQKIRRILETVSDVQQCLFELSANEDSARLDLLKIGTVFQIFFIDILASGKKPEDLTEEDWKSIAGKVYKFAVLEEGQRYCEFVFGLYVNYIDISVEILQGMVSDKNLTSIKELSSKIREKTEKLNNGEIDEVHYVEECLWLSLEAMIKLLYSFFTTVIPAGYAEFVQSLSQMAFEYGRYVLYSKEQAVLEKYIQNQYVLDEQLRRDYELYLEEVRTQAEVFRSLVENAFSSNVREALLDSAELARAAGVNEEEILTSPEDVDSFFLD